MADFKGYVQFLIQFCPRVVRNKMKVVDSELITILRFHAITVGYINNIFLNIFLYHKPGAATQPKSLPLSDGMEPIAAMRTQFLSGFKFNYRPFLFSKKTADKIIIIYLSEKTNTLTIFSAGTRQACTSCFINPPMGNMSLETCR